MSRIRLPTVAGTFYPADPRELAACVDGFLASATVPLPDDRPPVALIAPHAGLVYSGPIAASAYAQLRPWAATFERVVVVGVPHRARVRGVALCSADTWETPLGSIDVDTDACARLAARGGYVDDRAHAEEHSLEVHLPFLQRVLTTGWRMVPLIAGGAHTAAMADMLSPWWATPGTLVVVSTDLSHYRPQIVARRIDRATADDITAARWEGLESEQACGASGVRVALELARRTGGHVHLLDLRTSADTAGSSDRVVGYGSFAIR